LRKSIPELVVEFIDLTNQYIKREIRSTIESALVKPVQKLGFSLAVSIVAATLFSLSFIFLAVGLFQLLALVIGVTWIAYLIVAGGLFLAGLLLALVKKVTSREPKEK
jgi:hypothetical protein